MGRPRLTDHPLTGTERKRRWEDKMRREVARLTALVERYRELYGDLPEVTQ